ncbi:MAG: MTH1187 family thiamine-binding protein [candidate division Zixibacteria bacterium]
MLAIFSTFPLDKGQTLGEDVSEAIRLIDESGLDYQTTAMGTIVEGEWDEVMSLIKECHHKLRENSKRVNTKISIDDRAGAEGRLKGKVADIEKIIGREVKK